MVKHGLSINPNKGKAGNRQPRDRVAGHKTDGQKGDLGK